MTRSQIRALFKPGQTVTVTNHYITREDHPCFGTKQRTVGKVTSSHLHFATTEYRDAVPWRSGMESDGRIVRLFGWPRLGDLFLTIDTQVAP